MKEKTCCFTGHRRIPKEHLEWLPEQLHQAVLDMIGLGVTRFCCGGAMGFDMLAERAVIACRAENPEIQLCLFLPCKEQARSWNAAARKEYEEILAMADSVVYVSDHYYNGCMQSRNRRMVDESAYCISYLYGATGGTAYTVRYAVKKECQIVSLYQPE